MVSRGKEVAVVIVLELTVAPALADMFAQIFGTSRLWIPAVWGACGLVGVAFILRAEIMDWFCRIRAQGEISQPRRMPTDNSDGAARLRPVETRTLRQISDAPKTLIGKIYFLSVLADRYGKQVRGEMQQVDKLFPLARIRHQLDGAV